MTWRGARVMHNIMTCLARLGPGRRHAFLAILLGLAVIATGQPTRAALVQNDFATPGDGRLVTDTLTGLEYLSPFVTRGLSVNQIMGGVGGYLTTHGFRYAEAATVQGMIDTYFPGTVTTHPGTVAGFAVATAFMDFWGLNLQVFCSAGPAACPRSQGWAVEGATAIQLGMITFGATAYQILAVQATANISGFTDTQLGHWLIRGDAVSEVAEPGSLAVLGTGLVALLTRRRSRAVMART